MNSGRKPRRLSDAQVAFMRRCEREGHVLRSSLDGRGRRTARSLVTRGSVEPLRLPSGPAYVLTEAGARELSGTRRDPAPTPRRIIPRGSETSATSRRRVMIAERAAARARATHQVDAWNAAHPMGTPVDYHPVIGDPESRRHRTRSEAQVLPSGEPVVWLEGVAGCVSLDAVRPRPLARGIRCSCGRVWTDGEPDTRVCVCGRSKPCDPVESVDHACG